MPLSKVFTRKVPSTVLVWHAMDNVQRICLKACVFEGGTLEDSLVLSMVIASDRVRAMRACCAAVTTGLTRILREAHAGARPDPRPRPFCPVPSSRYVSHRLEHNKPRLDNTMRLFTLSNILTYCPIHGIWQDSHYFILYLLFWRITW